MAHVPRGWPDSACAEWLCIWHEPAAVCGWIFAVPDGGCIGFGMFMRWRFLPRGAFALCIPFGAYYADLFFCAIMFVDVRFW